MKITTVACLTSGIDVKLDGYISDAIVALYAMNSRIAAIKLARAHYQLSLVDAKELCDYQGGVRL